MWHYSFRSIKGTQADISAQACKVASSGDSTYTLILDELAKELSLMK